MTLHLVAALAAELGAAVAAAGEHECCGLLLGAREGDEARVERVLPIANVASAPAREFLLDATPVARALASARHGGPLVVGVFHSHPRSAAVPSPRDEREAWPEWSFLIVGRGADGARELRSYRRRARSLPLVEERVVVA